MQYSCFIDCGSRELDFDYQTLFVFFSVWLGGYCLLQRYLKPEIAASVMSIKVLIVSAYFFWFADNTWQIGGDSAAYLAGGRDLLERGMPWELFHNDKLKGHLYSLITFETGRIVPYLFFYFNMSLFGPKVLVPVLGNVLLTVGTGIFLMKSVESYEDSDSYKKFLLVYFSLHWSTICWSSFLIFKEPLVAFFLATSLYGASRLDKKQLWPLIVTGISLMGLRWTRYYYPVFIVFGISTAFLNAMKSRYQLLIVVPLIGIGAYWVSGEFEYFLKLVDPINAVIGVPHFLLQPAPWSITEPASFLLLPSILHWITVVPTIIGAFLLWRRGLFGQIVVFVAVASILFYGLIPAIASTRHRAPIEVLFILMQFEFFWWSLCSQKTNRLGIIGQKK